MPNKQINVRCPLCEACVPRSILWEHLIESHTDESNQSCIFCEKKFVANRVCEHMRSAHPRQFDEMVDKLANMKPDPGRLLRCDRCSRVFESHKEFVTHWYGRHGRELPSFSSVCWEARMNGVQMVRGGKFSPR